MKHSQSLFSSNHLILDLKRKSLRSGAATFISQASVFFIQLVSTIILARILSPRDYGINAMAVTITGLISVLSNMGISTAIIQRSEITHEQISTLFWINAAVGFAFTVLLAFLAPVIAWFYKAPELLFVMLALSPMFSISALTIPHFSLLTRQMRFYSLAKVQIISCVAGISSAIVTALYGFGYWALVLNTIVNTMCTTIGLWLSSRWIPCLPRRKSGISSMLRFASDIMGFNVINYFSRNLDNVLIGRTLGSALLGIYDKAYQLLLLPITNIRDPLTAVGMPALSRLQNDQLQYRNYYLKFLTLVAFISMPLVVFMLACSDQIILIVLGPKWIDAIPIFKLLSFAAFIQPVASTQGMILLSSGRSRRYLFVGATSSLIFSTSFILGLYWGPKGVALSYSVANYLLLFPSLLWTYAGTSIRIMDFIDAIYKPLLSSIVMGLACLLFMRNVASMGIYPLLFTCFSLCLFVYLLTFCLLNKGVAQIIEYFSYLQIIVGRSLSKYDYNS